MKKRFQEDLDVNQIAPEFYSSSSNFVKNAGVLSELIKENGDRAKIDQTKKNLTKCVIFRF
jgi:hypothetical protein